MELNSQICTTREQSERLVSLGLKKETADMSISTSSLDTDNGIKYSLTPYSECKFRIMYNVIPAWSLHRLIEMIPSFIDIGEHSYMFSIIQGKLFSYDSDIAGNAFLYGKGSVYDSVIYTIEWLIKIGEFNKNYLDIH